MKRDSQTDIRERVSKSSSFKFLKINELVKILAAAPGILFRIRDASPFELSFEAFPWLLIAWIKLSKWASGLSSVPVKDGKFFASDNLN